jgi:hypothetical protein
VRLRIQKDFGFSKAENVKMEEDVSMIPETTLEEGKVREKDKIPLKRKAGYDDSEDDCVFLPENTKKRMR